MLDIPHRDALRSATQAQGGRTGAPTTDAPQGLTSGLSLQTLVRALRAPDSELSAAEAASTLFRFFRSKHVMDLKLIIAAAVLLVAGLCVLVLTIGWIHVRNSGKATDVQIVDFFNFVVVPLGPALGVGGLIVAWAYRSASARLGVVDLYACEIGTLCRVGTIFEVGKIFVDLYNHPPAPRAAKKPGGDYVSQEDYFPVFDHNARDLQLLEALVVKNITEFYTYMKATRDSQRKLATLPPPEPGQQPDPSNPSSWHAAVVNVIYLLFLGYESGRKAIVDLIEFEPTAAEAIIVTLLTELKCYGFLREHFGAEDLRHARLHLREAGYRTEVRELCRTVQTRYGDNDGDWLAARRTMPELVRLYREIFKEDVDGCRLVPDACRAAKRPAVRAKARR